MAQQVLVLNATYEPINVCSLQRAVVLVLKNKAEDVEEHEQVLRSASSTYPRPHVIRLVTYVSVPRTAQRKISRRALFARDGWRCVYCGDTGGRLTLDHVVPRSKGGGSEWENVVTSCAPCNLRKGNRLPHEIEMHPRTRPRPPRPDVFISVAAPRQPPSLPTAPSRGRPPPAPRGRARPTSGLGRGPSRRSARSRVPGSR